MNGTENVGGEFTLVANTITSIPLRFNASAAEVAEAVNAMNSWDGLVLVDRHRLNDHDENAEDMFQWDLTFPAAMGNIPQLRVR